MSMIVRGTIAALALLASVGTANASIVTFEDQTGPSTFGNPDQTLTYTFGPLTATFTGGTILTQTTFLPADQTSVYGTESCCNTNPLTITFNQPVNNFFLDILNGNTVTEDYTVADNDGHSAVFSIPPNLSSGLQFDSIPATGTVITITSAASNGFWDFFIDNVGFNQPTPRNVPEPLTLSLFAAGLAGAAAMRRRRK